MSTAQLQQTLLNQLVSLDQVEADKFLSQFLNQYFEMRVKKAQKLEETLKKTLEDHQNKRNTVVSSQEELQKHLDKLAE
jgi:hypothetical protein